MKITGNIKELASLIRWCEANRYDQPFIESGCPSCPFRSFIETNHDCEGIEETIELREENGNR